MELITILLGLLPGFAWLFFFLGEDDHKEPKKLIAFTFIMGAAAAFVALFAELFLSSLIQGLGIARLSIFALLIFALTEEFIKFCAAYLSVKKNPAFDEPVDAMIYMVVAALGFATVENLGAINGTVYGQGALLVNIFATTSLRFVGATLLHALTSAIVGYYWAMTIREFEIKKPLLWGLLIATLLHCLFNYLIIILGNAAYTLVFLIIIAFFVLGDFEKLKKEAV
ncbi:MAG: PrsW family intramembrane metalloprotease [Patescibacteria group bacterium]|nr:PrsW family intramembrane metalloprotease [Patescibacteria group bacterium]MDE2014917.1 PrsW family intramembrane metalloprotease [Patescibacteria group bacterium]MDE2226346.1 PrsW family intramembrane metalloprotease [Patescibacteria group bacterium]